MADKSPHFFHRDGDGTVRIRLRFDADTASLIEEAAGATPVIVYIYEALERAANSDVEKARKARSEHLRPPEPGEEHE